MKFRRTLSAASFFILAAAVFGPGFDAQQPAAAEQADTDYQIGATLFMQKAAEFRALSFQAFNLARRQLDADLYNKNLRTPRRAERRKRRAIIVDIDETVLDNSPAQAAGIKARKGFNLPDWYAWSKMQKAKAIPGSVEFLNYATSKGVKVYYISNRDEVQKQDTIENLRKVGFKDISAENVLMRQKDSSGNNISAKKPRREFVSNKHRVVLIIGDNLDDFADVFERKSVSDRFAEVERTKNHWGKRWIVLPNAMYGTWENAIYEYQRLTEAQKAEKRAAALELP